MNALIDPIRTTLAVAPGLLRDFVAEIPEKALTAVRRKGFWTIREHIFHLAEVQPMMYNRLVRFRDEEKPNFIPYLPTDGSGPAARAEIRDVDHALRIFEEWRSLTVELVDQYPDEAWRKSGIHPEYLEYTAHGLLRHLMMHDHWHMYRMEELWLTRDEFLTEL